MSSELTPEQKEILDYKLQMLEIEQKRDESGEYLSQDTKNLFRILDKGNVLEMPIPKPKWIREDGKGKVSFDHISFSKEFLEENYLIQTEETIYSFDPKKSWRKITKTGLSALIVKKMGDYHTHRNTIDAMSYIMGQINFLDEGEEFNNLPFNLIPVENGLYNWKDDQIQDFNAFYRHDWKFPFPYVPEAKAERWEHFINFIAKDEGELIYEHFGYCFYRGMPFAKFLVILGGGNNGKSTLLGVLTKMLGQGNTTSMALNFISENRFATSNLVNKHANILADDKTDALDDTTNIKKATGGDQISVEPKGKSTYEAVLFAKFIVALNTPPYISDTSQGFKRRVDVLKLEKEVDGYFKDQLQEGELRIDYMEEASGIFNLFMDGLRRIMATGGRDPFSVTERMIKDKNEWLKDNNVVEQFIEEHCVKIEDKKGAISLKDFTDTVNDRMGTNYGSRRMKNELTALNVTVRSGYINKKKVSNVVFGLKCVKLA